MPSSSMLRHVLVIGGMALAASHACATTQFADEIMVDGHHYLLLERPIYAAFPADAHSALRGVRRYLKGGECSASVEGFMTRWEVSKGKLWLVGGIANPCSTKDPLPVSAYFPDQSGPVEAIWFTGKMKAVRELSVSATGCVEGKDEALQLTVERGRVTDIRPVDPEAARMEWGLPQRALFRCSRRGRRTMRQGVHGA